MDHERGSTAWTWRVAGWLALATGLALSAWGLMAGFALLGEQRETPDARGVAELSPEDAWMNDFAGVASVESAGSVGHHGTGTSAFVSRRAGGGGRGGGGLGQGGGGGRGRTKADAVAAGERYASLPESAFTLTHQDALSTFAVDVDTASYTNVRRFLTSGRLPPDDAVRVEELVNYFHYDDPLPVAAEPLAVKVEIAGCPWQRDHRLARIAIKTAEIPAFYRQPSNLVLLIDVSGSMEPPNKLPLLKRGLRLMIASLSARDTVSMVVYAGASGLALEPTRGDAQERVLAAIERLKAGGSTNGGEGIRLAYQVAHDNLIPGGTNRVILATDGDFNFGVTDDDELVQLIRDQAQGGVFLSVLGFGTGNLNDARLEQLADQGNGHYAYVDDLQEARRVLVEELGTTLVTVAKDVKIQVEFEPALVAAFRLIGYENRRLKHEEFADDARDAGEIGAGHGVTALYEIVPRGAPLDGLGLDPEAVRAVEALPFDAHGYMDTLVVRVRYKEPEGDTSRLLSFSGFDAGLTEIQTSDDFRFSAAVAAFGMLLGHSPHRGHATFENVRVLAERALGSDHGGHRAGFLELVDRALALERQTQVADRR